MMTQPTLFDRRLKAVQRNRAAPQSANFDFLFQEVGERLIDRLQDVKRTFDHVLDIGCRNGALARMLAASGQAGFIAGCDLSPAFAAQSAETVPAFVADEERLPVKEGSIDLVTSCLALHWANDLPGALVQINRALKPDGLFQGALLGGETLFELRECLLQAEAEIRGGASPRISPMAELRDIGGLMQRAGFALPVVDSEIITVTYPHLFKLMADLRGMGETNAVFDRPKQPTGRGVFMRAAALYAERFPAEDGRVTASFEIIWMHGWRPAANQQKPLRPGSAKSRLADALGVTEFTTDIPANGPIGKPN